MDTTIDEIVNAINTGHRSSDVLRNMIDEVAELPCPNAYPFEGHCGECVVCKAKEVLEKLKEKEKERFTEYLNRVCPDAKSLTVDELLPYLNEFYREEGIYFTRNEDGPSRIKYHDEITHSEVSIVEEGQ
jgi:hypothetical protein